MYRNQDKAYRFFRTACLAVLLCTVFLNFTVQAQTQSAVPKILILNSYHRASWSDDIFSGVQSVLNGYPDIFFYIEYMDTKRIYTEEYLRELHELYALKYRDVTFDVIIAADDNAYQYALEYHADLFKNAPVVFCGVSQFDPARIAGLPVTGVLEMEPYEETLAIALKLQPQTKVIYVLCDYTVTASINLERFKRILADRYPAIQYKLLRDLTVDEMSEALATIPDDAIVLAISWWQDSTGRAINPAEWEAILRNANRPVFGFSTWQVGRGLTGGKCSSGFQQGRMAGELAKQVLEGTDIRTLPVFDDNKDASVYIFDYLQLQKYQIPQSLLPEETIILNAPTPFYEISRKVLWSLVGGVIVLLGLVIGLMLFISHHHSVHRAVQEKELRFRNLVEATSDWIWEIDTDCRYTYVSPQCRDILGYEPEELIGKTPFDLMPPEEADRIREIHNGIAAQKQSVRQVENLNFHKDGREVVLESSAIPILDKTGRLVGYRGVDRDITARKNSERVIQRHQAEINSIFKAAPVGIGLTSNRVLLRVNDRICEMTGYSQAELVGQNSRILYLTQEDYENVGAEKYGQIKETGTGTVETRWLCKDGRIIDILLSSTPIDPDDWSKGITFTALDITRTKTALLMAAAERDKAQQYLDIAGVMMLVLDVEGRVQLLNKRGCEILECTEGHARGKDWFTHFLPESVRKTARKVFCDLIIGAGQAVEYFENTIITATGKQKIIAWHNTAIRDETGQITGTLSSGLDVTEHVQAQRKLKFTQFAVDRGVEAAFWMKSDGTFFYVNDKACQSLGYTCEELLSLTIHDIDPDFPPEAWADSWPQLRVEGTRQLETYHKTKDGRVFPVEITANFVEYDGIEYNCAFARDITERKQADEALQESENKHRSIFTSASDAIFVMDEHHFIECNPQAVTLFGCKDPSEIISKTPVDFSPVFQEDGRLSSESAQEKCRLTLEGQNQRFPWVHQKKDGSFVYVEVSLSAIELKGQTYIQALVRDMTQQRQDKIRQERLLKELQSKNEELESIVFIASHDLRSPLVNIRGFAGELEKSLVQLQHLLADEKLSESAQKQLEYLFNTDIPESLGFISAGNQKMDVLLTGLLRLSRIGTAQVCSVKLDMDEMLESIVDNFRFRIRNEEIEITVDKPMPTCLGDAVLVNQVFTNLIDNAIKYHHPDRKTDIHVSAEVKPEGVVYRVADNGIGIDPKHIEKVFEIFHRLNPGEGDGEGLGLTIVTRILDRQEGHVWIESEPDVGTSVYVQLPNAS